MESLRTLKSVKPLSDTTLRVRWSNGTAADLDLSDLLKQKAFKSLRGRGFQRVSLDEWGHSVEWPDGTAIGADALWRRTLLARGHEDAVTFMDWRLSHGLSLSEAGEALGLSRRMVAYYSSGARAVPKTVLLACRGWEYTRDAA
jgi:hypothetical protein